MRTRGVVFVLALVAVAACSRVEPLPPTLAGPTPAALELRALAGSSATASFVVGNVGAGPLTFRIADLPGWLEAPGPTARTVAPGDAVRVPIEALCAPEGGAGTRRGAIRLESDDRDRAVAEVAVDLRCEAPAAAPALTGPTPAALAFEAEPGASATASFVVGNAGDAPLAFEVASAPSWLEVRAAAARTVAPGEEAVVEAVARCSAAAGETYRFGVIRFASNDPERAAGEIDASLFCDAAGETPDPAPPTDEPAPEEPVPDEPVPESGFRVDVRFFGATLPTASQRRVFEDAAARWSEAIRGDLPDVRVERAPDFCYGGEPALSETVDDVLILASVVPMDGPYGILGSAGPCILRGPGGLPVVGVMEFDEADVAELENAGGLRATVLHEMGHVLGIGTLWQNGGHDRLDADTWRCTAGETTVARFVGAEATHEHEAAGGIGRPWVETDGPAGTACGHWDEARYHDELMTGWLSGEAPMSRMTIGSLGDLGYEVDLAAADPWAVPDRAALRAPPAGRPLEEILRAPVDTVP